MTDQPAPAAVSSVPPTPEDQKTAARAQEMRDWYAGKPTPKHDLVHGCAPDCPCKGSAAGLPVPPTDQPTRPAQCGKPNTASGAPDFYYHEWRCGRPVGHEGQCSPFWGLNDGELPDRAAGSVVSSVVPTPATLEDRLVNYLTVRNHTLTTAHLSGKPQLVAEAKYVQGEANELVEAAEALPLGGYLKVRREIADVVLAATTMARYLGTTVEACIEEKTEADRGRG